MRVEPSRFDVGLDLQPIHAGHAKNRLAALYPLSRVFHKFENVTVNRCLDFVAADTGSRRIDFDLLRLRFHEGQHFFVLGRAQFQLGDLHRVTGPLVLGFGLGAFNVEAFGVSKFLGSQLQFLRGCIDRHAVIGSFFRLRHFQSRFSKSHLS